MEYQSVLEALSETDEQQQLEKSLWGEPSESGPARGQLEMSGRGHLLAPAGPPGMPTSQTSSLLMRCEQKHVAG